MVPPTRDRFNQCAVCCRRVRWCLSVAANIYIYRTMEEIPGKVELSINFCSYLHRCYYFMLNVRNQVLTDKYRYNAYGYFFDADYFVLTMMQHLSTTQDELVLVLIKLINI